MATYRTRTGKDGATSVHTMVRLAGYPTRTATLPNMRDAKRWAATVEAEMVEGRHFKGTEGRKRTLAEAIARYRAEVLPLKRNGSMYGFTLDWWETNHGTKKLGEVSRGWLSDARAQLLAGTFTRATPGSRRSMYAAVIPGPDGGPAVPYKRPTAHQRTPATANRYMAALSSVFSHVCGDWEWLQPHANPFAGFSKLPEGRNKGRAYADDARARLLQETAKDPQLHVLVQVALATAARAGELLGLTWSHVELGDTEGRLMFVDTKNGEARIAWLFGDALESMRRWHAHQFPAGTHPAGLSVLDHLSRPVFPGQWSHKHQRYGKYDYLPRLHKALKAAGLDMKRPFHALRHTAATNLARMGANGHQLKSLGGWKSNAVDTYVHLAGQDTKELAKRLASDTGSK
jgi:integrase